MKNIEPSSPNGGPATAPPSSNDKSKAKAKSIPNGPNANALTPGTTQVQTSWEGAVVKLVGSTAVAEVGEHAPERQRLVDDDGPQRI